MPRQRFALKGLDKGDVRMLTKEAEKEISTLKAQIAICAGTVVAHCFHESSCVCVCQRCKVPGVITYYESYHFNNEAGTRALLSRRADGPVLLLQEHCVAPSCALNSRCALGSFGS